MNSTEKQLGDMLKELQSRSKAKVILESAIFAVILLFLFVGNFITLLIMVLNRRMRTIPNMFVASLAISDLSLGVFSACSLSGPVLVTSQWLFSDVTCQYQGYMAVTLGVASVHTLALMAVNRFFRIVKPAKYGGYFTKKKTTIMIIVTWLYSMCCFALYLQWTQNGVSSLQVFLLSPDRQRCIHSLFGDSLCRISCMCHLLLLC